MSITDYINELELRVDSKFKEQIKSWPDETKLYMYLHNIQLSKIDSMLNSKENYIRVLITERDILLKEHYNPNESGTGHFNTAIGVLNFRINNLTAELNAR